MIKFYQNFFSKIFFIFFLFFILSATSNCYPQNSLSQATDWLINPSIYKAKVLQNEEQKEITLTNGLIKRVLRTKPNCSTVDYQNLATGEAIIRAVRPEAILWINGRKYAIGGLHGQVEQAYLLRQWIDELTVDSTA